MKSHWQVIIVGAGPAGISVAVALQRCGIVDFTLLDARQPGASFDAWPREMRMLTPSFNSNPFGQIDLNAVDPETSPADFLRTQHPSGRDYAKYLRSVVQHHALPVAVGVEVSAVRKNDDGDFELETTRGLLRAQMVVWAAGQFFYPRNDSFPGASECLHTSEVGSWSDLEGDDFTVVGGYESGIDALVNLCELGKRVRLVSQGEPWAVDSADPSRSLSPRTLDRLRSILSRPAALPVELLKDTVICRVEEGDTWWVLYDQDDVPLVSHTRPILATGYEGSLSLISDLFEENQGLPVFSEACDESTRCPGLFYSGPELVHRNSMFCFIYKFRSRAGLIAREIANRLGISDADELLADHAKTGFMVDDLDCCTNCECAIEPEGEAPQPAAFG